MSQMPNEPTDADLIAKTGDGGYVKMSGPRAIALGDLIRRLVSGDVVIIRGDVVHPRFRLWEPPQ